MEGDNTERENKVQKFSDFAKDKKYLTGDKKDIKEILNCPIIVTGYKKDKSKFKPEDYVAIQFHKIGEKDEYVVFTGAVVLKEQLDTYHQHIPFETTKLLCRYLYTDEIFNILEKASFSLGIHNPMEKHYDRIND